MLPLQTKAKIIANKKIKERYWHLELESTLLARSAEPGQFINIKVSAGLEPLLRRPISIHKTSGKKVKLFYEALGVGTQVLSSRQPGELLDIIGPLGNGFKYRHLVKATGTSGKHQSIIIAGGMGVAPLVFLAEKIRPKKPLVLIGAKTKQCVLCADDFRALGCKVSIATDDGSQGFKGTVADLLKNVLGQQDSAELFSCGPHRMLKAVAEIAREKQIPLQCSLEEHMSCGFGACLGCVVATKSGYQRVCQEGPVFPAEELIW